MNASQTNSSRARTLQPDRTRVLTGIKPTGDLHLGNYFGAIKPAIAASNDPGCEVILMCVDWHGMTDRANITTPGRVTLPQLATYLALGFNTEGNCFILQSHFPQILENAWALACVAPVGLLERAHAFKDAVANGKDATGGLLYYPVLMASDILSFDAQSVPVGKDQAQHLEYASDLAKAFNNAVKADVFLEPKAQIQDTPVLVGIDGERKMSKSYNNQIPLFGSRKEIEKRVKEIKTDSKGLDDPKDPDTCAIYLLLKAFGSEEAVSHMRERLSRGTGYGYGHAKKDFLDEYERVFGSKRELYEHFLKSPDEVRKHMEKGYERAHAYADAVRRRAREGLGLLSR